jgi:PAS domain S-box-containing protein
MPGVGIPKIDTPALRIAYAIIAVAAAFLLRQILVVHFALALPPFITFYPVVMVVALLAGFRVGLLATLLSALLADFWIFPPVGRLPIASVPKFISVAVFIALCVLTSAVAERYRRSEARLAALEKEQELRGIKTQLQQVSDYQRLLIAALDEGLALCEMMYDENGAAYDYRILEVNKAYERQTGLTSDEVQGKTALQVFPDIERFWIDEFAKIAAIGSAERFENFNHNTARHYETFICSVGGGKFILLIRDISERKRAERKLSESEQRLRVFIEHAPVALAMFDNQMRYLYVSRRWMADYRLGDRDLRGLSHYEIFPEVSADWKAAHRRGLAGEVVRKEADPFERASGTLQWVRWELRPWNDAEGKIGGIVIFTEDITERKNAEEAVLESQAKLQGIVGSAMDAVISVNEQQRIVVFNRAAETIFACPASEAIGTTLDRFLPAAVRASHSEHIRRFGTEGETARSMTSPAILTAVRFGGEEFPIEATISHVQVGGENLFTVILRDVTERKRAEDKLRWSEDQLRALAARLHTASERERLRIARELHDELGSILTGMKMDLDWIVRKHEAGENNWISMVQDSIKAVDSTIVLVRRLATELRPQMLDSAGLAAAIEWHVAEFQRRTAILCAVQVPEDTFGLSSDQRIAIFRICQEALTNIARHSQAKHVLVTLAREPTEAILTINDDGVGFNVDEVVHTPALGIVGMRERAVLLGAQIHIESAPGDGSTISLRIPLGAV